MTGPALVLIGMPAAGKSTVAAALGEHLGVRVLDTDEIVAAQAGMLVSQAWVDLGEERVRALESRAVDQALTGPEAAGAVVALGSGALDGPAGAQARRTLQTVREAGTPVVNLEVSLAALAPRQGLLGPQPVGLGAPRALLAQFAQARAPLYRDAADLTLDTSRLEVAGVTDHIRRWLATGEDAAPGGLS